MGPFEPDRHPNSERHVLDTPSERDRICASAIRAANAIADLKEAGCTLLGVYKDLTSLTVNTAEWNIRDHVYS
eukprot:gene17260-biopygen23331